jgi:Ca2+-transporting ATPase
MAFTLLTFAQMGHVLAIRSEHTSLAALGVFSNRPLVGAVALTVTLQLLIIYIAPLQRVFGTTALSIGEFVTVVVLSAVIPFAVEIEKAIARARR